MGIGKEICRIEKIKSTGELRGAYLHNLRLKSVPNANEIKTSYNIELTNRPAGKSYAECFQEKISRSDWYKNSKHKVAKNAVYAVEFMLTFGNEASEKIDLKRWGQDNVTWLKQNFGGEDNLISAVLHVDEKTPHIHAIVIPFDEKGKLNYTKYLGGSKYRLSEMQDKYHQEVGCAHNLDRGIKGSKASHQDIDTFYSLVNEALNSEPLPEPAKKTNLFKKEETASEYRSRIEPMVQSTQKQANVIKKENLLLKQRVKDIEHLQDGVVSISEYNSLNDKLKKSNKQLKTAKRNEQFATNWALEEKERREEAEKSFSEKITAAVHNATIQITNLYNNLLKKYNTLKAKYDTLLQKYQTLKQEHSKLKKDFNSLAEKSKDITSHLKDKELMYAILDNQNIAHIYDKCKAEQLQGYSHSANAELAKFKHRHNKAEKKSSPAITPKKPL